MEGGLQACACGWEAFTLGASRNDEKKKSKLADDPNPQLPPPPLSRARLAAKVEEVFKEVLPMSAPRRVLPIKPVKPSRPEAPPSPKPRGRPPGKKPPKTLAERQQAFRDRKREEKS